MLSLARLVIAIAIGFLAMTFGLPASHGATLFTDTGVAPADIQGTVDAFRAALGNPNNGNAPGPLTSGRREINWDGGGSDATATNAGALNAFRNTRGAQFLTPGTGFVQAPASGGANGGLATLFANPSYATSFQAFSPVRLFAPLGSNVTEAVFSIPGTNGAVPAAVTSFGAVFSDVDLAGSTLMRFFDHAGELILSVDVPELAGDGTLSFVGVLLDPFRPATRIEIVTGNTALGPTDNPGGGLDVVVMDDFIFAEPRGIPAPAALGLLGVGLLAAGARLRRGRAAYPAASR
jgi:hypothetical protein